MNNRIPILDRHTLAGRIKHKFRIHPELLFQIPIGLSLILLVLSYLPYTTPLTHIFNPHMAHQMPNLPKQLLLQMPALMLMTLIMMGPAALPGIRHAGISSLYWRRKRSMAEYAFGYLSCWLLCDVLLMACLMEFDMFFKKYQILITFLVISAFWQTSFLKKRFMEKCHKVTNLPPKGYRAELASIRFGIYNGSACVGTCWPLMAVAMSFTYGKIIFILLITAYTTIERRHEKPGELFRLSGIAFGVLSVLLLLPALL